MSFYDALLLPLDEITGVNTLIDRYMATVSSLEDGLWGYVEVDQGGHEVKTENRERMEKEGLRPIPVYHPLNDPPAYFDFLAERYDRICVANVVMSPAKVRQRILYAVERRRQRFPGLKWIHLLGYTPNEWIAGYGYESCDSSRMYGGAKWGAATDSSLLKFYKGLMQPQFYSEIGNNDPEDSKSHYRLWELCGHLSAGVQSNWRNWRSECHTYYQSPQSEP